MAEYAATATSSHQIKTTAIPNSPFPTRLLKLIRDEEEWLSGSELKTDNSSSSDDEMSPTSQNKNKKKFNQIKKRRKCKANYKGVASQKQNVDEDNISTTTDGSLNKSVSTDSNEINRGKIMAGTGDTKQANLLYTTIAESNEDDSEIYWRPKRGSISLTGLVNELNKTSISDIKS